VNKFKYWYRTRGRKTRKAVSAVAVAVCLVVVGIIGYMLFVPRRIEVRFGTIVRDPVDGHVWEDKTKTAVVDENQAHNYTINYVDKLSPEHQKQQEEQNAQQAAEETQAENTQIIQPATPIITDAQLQSMRNLQQSVDVVGQGILDGMKILNGIVQIRPQLVNYRNQVANMAVAPQLEPLKQKLVGVFDDYIAACDLYVQAVVTGNVDYAHQANAKIAEATAAIQDFVPTAQEFKDIVDEFIKIVRQIWPF
jgi:hypothetical protein